MTAKQSAGLLPFRRNAAGLEVFIVHPGGPFWAHKDDNAWSMAKGEYTEDEDAWATAQREFAEEVGTAAPVGDVTPLGEVKQPSGKVVTAFAVEADLDVEVVRSNTFTLEWPPGSSRMVEFPEVDAARWMSLDEARVKLIRGQREFLDRLVQTLQ